MNTCINCNHDLVNVVYGYPSEKLIELAKTEGIALGGKKYFDSPTHYCYGCHDAFTAGVDDQPTEQTLFSN
jgi:hypothetical protein